MDRDTWPRLSPVRNEINLVLFRRWFDSGVRVLPSEPRFRPSSSSFSCSTPFAGFVILDEQPLRLQEVPCWYLRKPYEESMG
jgi:hypothetical protein